jgi:hypothetical protein
MGQSDSRAPIIPFMQSTFQSPSRNQRPRDQRLDFWRGLCLIDMVLVHLYYNNVQFGEFLGKFLGDYTRFAAGGFIFVSGMSIGVIFWPRAQDDSRRAATFKGMWRRSLFILGVSYISGMLWISMEILRGDRGNFNDPLALLRDLFLLREGGDLLPFYVLMIAISPIILQALRKKWGWLCVLVASLSLFTWGLWHPWAFAPAEHLRFPPVLWQATFILGLLFGFGFPRYNALAKSWKVSMAAFSWLIAGVLFVMEYSYLWGMPQLAFGTAFTRVPLNTFEGLRYLSIIFGVITTTDVLWPYIGGSGAAAFVQTLGRKSLPVYVLHLWVVEAMGALAVAWSFMGAWQIIFAVFSVLILWLFALILDVTGPPKTTRHVPAPAIPSIFRREPMAGAAR